MPLVTDYQQVKDIYQETAEMGVGLPVFCAEDKETFEAILASALELGKKIGADNLPIIPAWTSRYPARGQMMPPLRFRKRGFPFRITIPHHDYAGK